ncbi:pyrroline-5-carboxylate reductase [Tessaracoccus antarcticus]|uniref:Pyrroline-5-carboxylate reductase n=1 Tax=Tessaracoccus antarcticus TaxID=2479848 RepID=A0A3M0GHS8_9ACTN|nr:pyrroline-5-carboxylate reductase [Tessaracoccus antarcticus]RMB61143.1 pyrroline-5-carboxylate reductase [Tessaracoccus antarcticus]
MSGDLNIDRHGAGHRGGPGLAVVGAGAMGEALLAGWLKSGWEASDIVIVDAHAPRVAELEQRHGVRGVELAEAAAADTLVLAVKPHQMSSVLESLSGALRPESLVVSIAAGVTLDQLAAGLPHGQGIIRVMPNTPALVGQGMAGIAPGAQATEMQCDSVIELFRAVGKAIVVDESSLHALTGLSGSGPAYLFYIAEAMIEAGVHQGLSRPQATELVHQTFLGAGTMLEGSGESATVLRERVTSPGGTTAAALRAMDDHGVRSGMLAAVEACVQRSRDMSR